MDLFTGLGVVAAVSIAQGINYEEPNEAVITIGQCLEDEPSKIRDRQWWISKETSHMVEIDFMGKKSTVVSSIN